MNYWVTAPMLEFDVLFTCHQIFLPPSHEGDTMRAQCPAVKHSLSFSWTFFSPLFWYLTLMVVCLSAFILTAVCHFAGIVKLINPPALTLQKTLKKKKEEEKAKVIKKIWKKKTKFQSDCVK